MEKNKTKKMKRIMTGLLIILLLCGCSKNDDNYYPVGTLWSESPVSLSGPQVDPEEFGNWNYFIYDAMIRGMDEFSNNYIEPLPYSQGEDVGDLTLITERMVNQDRALMVIGAGSHSSSMHAASVTNFFEVPMLIPFVDGDDIIREESNIWSFRTTPNSSDYTKYIKSLFGTNWRERFNQAMFPDSPILPYNINIGIIFEDTTYGHSMAVNLGQELMDMGMNLDLYLAYKPGETKEKLEAFKKEQTAAFNGIDILFFIGEVSGISVDDSMSGDIMNAINQWIDFEEHPVFIIVGNNTPQFLTDNTLPKWIYAIRQQYDLSACPEDITTYIEQAGYSTGYLTGMVLDQALKNVPKPAKGFFDFLKSSQTRANESMEYVKQMREEIRSTLQNLDADIPCLGHVSFNENYMVSTEIELVAYTGGVAFESVDTEVLLNYLAEKIKNEIISGNG